MRYLASNDTHTLSIPVIVGAEYTLPTGQGKLTTKIGSDTVHSVIPLEETSTLEVPVTVPLVNAGELKIMGLMLVMPTAIGQFTYREFFGVLDLMDIPATGDSVRNLLGLTNYELADSDMDLEGKYLALYNLFINDFHNKRQVNQYLTKLFGDLISIFEAIALAPTLIIRIDKKRKTENGDFSRFGDAGDLGILLDDLNNKKGAILDELADFLEPQVSVNINHLQFIPMYNYATAGA